MKVVCVTGMHRSGTSLTSRVVELLGVDLGAHDHFLDTKPDNPTGYWENRDITRLNDALLRLYGATWRDPPHLSSGWELASELDELRGRAALIVESTFGGAAVAGWKDPRMSILLPFWRTVVPVHKVILVVRHPVEVAASLGVRDGMGSEEACALWLRYSADAWINGRDPMLLAFAELFERPAEVVVRLSGYIGLSEPGEPQVQSVEEFIDASLRHHIAVTATPGPNTENAVALFELLMAADRDAVTEFCMQLRRTWIIAH